MMTEAELKATTAELRAIIEEALRILDPHGTKETKTKTEVA